MRTAIGKFLKALGNALIDEVDEVAHLVPTEEDREQGQKMAVLTVTALTAMGCPLPAVGTTVIAKVYAYGLRDLKDGVKTPDKLIVKRVINEIKEQKEKPNEAQ